MAVQGKLVPQDPNDEPASVLLDHIYAEKEKLIKEGKIKKEKNPSRIFRGADNLPYEKIGKNEPVCIAEEIPFEIPDSWEWVRLNEICEYIQRGRSPKYSPIKKYPVIAQKCNQWSGFSIEKAQFIDPESISTYGPERILQDYDLMWNSTGLGTLGRMAIYKTEANPYELAVADSHVTVIRPLKTYVKAEYLYYYFANPTVQNVIEKQSDGSTKQKELSTKTIKSYLVPLPPLNEQNRIISRLASLLVIVNKYNSIHEKLIEVQEEFPVQLRKSILQQAISGKLVPQNPADEPASILLERIHKEKCELVKQKKIKCDKHESFIFRRDNSYYEMSNKIEHGIDEELPFEIPETWAWARLRDICFDLRYGTSNKSSLTGDIIVLRMGNIQNGEIDYSDLVFSSNQKDNEKYRLEPMDILFNRTNSREHVGKTGIYRGEYPAIFAGYLVQIKPIHINPEYLNIVMNSEYERNYCKDVKSDGINQSNVNATKIGHFLIPVPPINEQKRIVESINRILPVMAAFKEKM
jgi:type I restriction enzyme S subunit